MMSFSKVYSAQASLLDACRIDIETDISRGLHNFTIIGLGDKAIDESRDRVSSAIKNSGFISPKQRNEKIVISLAPASLRKNGGLFDVAIALSYLKAVGEIDFNTKESLFFGELALNGEVRRVHGILPLAVFAKRNNFKNIFVPKDNAYEAAIISGINIYPVENLKQIINHLENKEQIQPQIKTIIKNNKNAEIDLSDIKGQYHTKRALTIAAAGRHNIALIGPPGTGKTLLAKAFANILPQLSFDEMLDVTSIHSVSGILEEPVINYPPIRTPHHTASYASIFGGGSNMRPGEVTLAHKGILFLDEFSEFEKRTIEGLRQPIEDRVITISRASGTVRYPADFILITTLNPCPCGFYGSSYQQCSCTMQQISRYMQKMSGPIMDRIDIWVDVPNVDHEKILTKHSDKESESSKVRELVIKARKIQKDRLSLEKISTNSEMSSKMIDKYINIKPKIKEILITAIHKMGLSVRGCHKVLKLARTIADLDNSKEIKESYILEALQYRPKYK